MAGPYLQGAFHLWGEVEHVHRKKINNTQWPLGSDHNSSGVQVTEERMEEF